MLNPTDHIMVRVSGGKDSASLLMLLQKLQQQVGFQLATVHVDQQQSGYNGTRLVRWLEDDVRVSYRVVQEDTYSIVVEKTLARNPIAWFAVACELGFCTRALWSSVATRSAWGNTPTTVSRRSS
jgi:tRNA(Ile)-lysidine synthase TilS/MesJ